MSHVTKICLIGDFSVGKTSLVRRFTESRFGESYLSTIGVRVSRKVLHITPDGSASLTMLIWDTAGSEPFNDIVRSYYQGSGGALLVCDLTRAETAASLYTYAHDFHTVNPGVPLVVMANKLDLLSMRTISDELLNNVAATLGAPVFLTSARMGTGVDEAFQTLGQLIWNKRSTR